MSDVRHLGPLRDGAYADRMVERAAYEVRRVIAGQDVLLERTFVALFARGHLLLEGVPGLAKTLTIKTVAGVLGGTFQRVQFTPDLVPSDLVGTRVYRARRDVFDVELGPVFCNFLLADEINRAPAKVQSALLEVMQEGHVTLGKETFAVPSPFLVMATQNPIESEGTYALPEAQLDRFMLKVLVDYPDADDELVVIDRALAGAVEVEQALTLEELAALQDAVREVYVDPTVADYIVRLVSGTRGHPDVYLGASPRGSIALYRAGQALAGLLGRDYVIPDDIKALAEPALAHRLIIKTSSSIHDVQAGQVIRELLESTAVDGIRPTGVGGPREIRSTTGAGATQAPTP